ncbi:hypothetical protein [Reyranella sp.]|uniref:hypothetical protein n=1 Tax=Reyranella sp. TaxID=1929291 RepID=UPI003D14C4CE
MNDLLSASCARRKTISTKIHDETALPLAVRLLVRRFNLLPGVAAAVAAAAGFNMEVR